jgi:hypothetical protein
MSTDIRLSTAKYATIVQKDDGLFLEDIWIDWQSINEFDQEVDRVYQETLAQYQVLSDQVALIDDPEEIDQWIIDARDSFLEPLNRIIDYVDDIELLSKEMKEYTDEKISDLEKEFYAMNPMTSWGTF